MHDETTCICNYNSMHDLFHLIIHQCCNLLHTNAVKQVDYNGYITWGKLGYTMLITPREQFEKLLREHNRTEETLFELLKTKEGYEFWKRNGFSWSGIFFLTEGSENITLLKEYLKTRNINVPLL